MYRTSFITYLSKNINIGPFSTNFYIVIKGFDYVAVKYLIKNLHLIKICSINKVVTSGKNTNSVNHYPQKLLPSIQL